MATRGKTSPESTAGSYAPSGIGSNPQATQRYSNPEVKATAVRARRRANQAADEAGLTGAMSHDGEILPRAYSMGSHIAGAGNEPICPPFSVAGGSWYRASTPWKEAYLRAFAAESHAIRSGERSPTDDVGVSPHVEPPVKKGLWSVRTEDDQARTSRRNAGLVGASHAHHRARYAAQLADPSYPGLRPEGDKETRVKLSPVDGRGEVLPVIGSDIRPLNLPDGSDWYGATGTNTHTAMIEATPDSQPIEGEWYVETDEGIIVQREVNVGDRVVFGAPNVTGTVVPR